MGNYRFKLSDMIPNSWFYKLKDMSTRKRNHKKSHHFTGELAAGNCPAEPPRKSTKVKRKSATAATAAAAARSSPRLVATYPAGCSCTRMTAGPRLPPVSAAAIGFNDIFEKGHEKPARKINGSDEELKSLPQIDLPPIITTSSSKTDAIDGSTCPSVTGTKKDKSIAREPRSTPSRRFPVNSPGPKFRITNSPRVSSKRFGILGRRKSGSAATGKRSLTDSLAIVKSTNDPQKEFRESMVEMIVENKISGSNELEDLLACYLSLNSGEYHDIIIKVFKQIWFDMSDIGIA